MGSDDISPAKSRLLSRRPPEELAHLQESAAAVLTRLYAQGKLSPIGTWRNEEGDLVQSWPTEEGDVLACYMDMLGLNGRPIVEYSAPGRARQRASRKRARAARG